MGIEAPSEIPVYRDEVYHRMRDEIEVSEKSKHESSLLEKKVGADQQLFVRGKQIDYPPVSVRRRGRVYKVI